MADEQGHDAGRRGPRIRTDIVDVYVARRGGLGLEFLQLHRSRQPLLGSWQPIMGHIEEGETAVTTARREMREEVGLGGHVGEGGTGGSGSVLLGLWQLEQVHPFFMAGRDEIVLSPRFVAEVSSAWKPVLNHEHDQWRWVVEGKVDEFFVWSGQRLSIAEAAKLLRGDVGAEGLRLA